MAIIEVSRESVGAIIVNEEGRYLLQGRDRKPGIHLPGYWGLFGGSTEAGETPESAIRRELEEELSLEAIVPRYMTHAIFNAPAERFQNHRMVFFEARPNSAQLASMVLNEGERMAWFSFAELATQQHVTPWAVYGVCFHRMWVGGQL